MPVACNDDWWLLACGVGGVPHPAASRDGTNDVLTVWRFDGRRVRWCVVRSGGGGTFAVCIGTAALYFHRTPIAAAHQPTKRRTRYGRGVNIVVRAASSFSLPLRCVALRIISAIDARRRCHHRAVLCGKCFCARLLLRMRLCERACNATPEYQTALPQSGRDGVRLL